MTQKHAYLIMAHNNFYCLEKLICLLDDNRNDIYLHIDKKVKNFDFDKFNSICKNASLLYPRQRINVQWGTQSQVSTEMLLFKTAHHNGPYSYYHLISGSDLPLKTQDEIHQFFANKTASYMFYQEVPSIWDYHRVSRYHNVFGTKGNIPNRLNSYLAVLQEKFGIDRLKKRNIQVKRGSNWTSISHDAVGVLLNYSSEIMRFTRFSVCADELYKQSLLLSKKYHNIQNDDLRLIDWSTGGNHPHTFTIDDFERLIHSDKLFARKFDESVDKQIIDRIFDYIKQLERHV